MRHRERWRVVDGFFIDTDEKVVTACRRMIENEEKALPYAGAAWPLDSRPRVSGRIFCFLPVPVQTIIPIQVNGYFDLDDSRQNLFLDPSAHGAAAYRVQWNKELLETSVVQAYIKLMEDLRLDLEANGIDTYYKAFPSPAISDSSWEGWFTASFYKQASNASLIKVADETSWYLLSETRTLPQELEIVREAFIQEKILPIPHPPFPEHVQNGFKKNNINVPTLTPRDLRIRLKKNKDINCPIDHAPHTYLQKREFIEQILRFCLSDSPKDDIRGLPLLIDCASHIRTVGVTELPLYLMDYSRDLEVFAEYPEWFVDTNFAKELNLVEIPTAGLVRMDGTRFVKELSKYVSAKNKNKKLKMSTDISGVFTDKWLQAVFNRLLGVNLNNLKDDICKIPLVPDQNLFLNPMGHLSTPLLYNRNNDELKQALITLSVPMVSGVSNELFQLLINFSEKKGLIWQVTPHDLIDTLLDSCSDEIEKYETVTEVQRAILDYLSREESLNLLKKKPDRYEKLKKLRIFPTVNGALVDLRNTAYIAQDFMFPPVNYDVVLLDNGPMYKWRELYLLLGVPKLSRSRMIVDILLPGFEYLDAVEMLEASSWLRDNLNLALNENELDSHKLFEKVRNTPFIICEDGELREPMSVYHPESKLAKSVMGENAAIPDMNKTYANKSEIWLSFFRQLGMPTEPRLSDIQKYLSTVISTNISYDSKKVRFQAVYEYLKERVESELKEKKDISTELSVALKKIAELSWIPIRQEPGDLICFKRPKVSFARPGEVYFLKVGQLVASQAYITVLRNEPNKRVCKAMGFPIQTPLSMVIKHFQQIIRTYSNQETIPNESFLIKGLGQIYRFFGGVGSEIDDPVVDIDYQSNYGTESLVSLFSEVPCIWDHEMKRFWRPDHVFSDNVKYMEPWRRTIRAREDNIEYGYTALGRRQKPNIEDLKQVLNEIAASRKSSEVVREVIRHVVEELVNDNITDGEVLVPTRNGKMLPAKNVFIADAPWYELMLDSWEIPILSSHIANIFEIQRMLEILSLAQSIQERLIKFPIDSKLEESTRECARLEGLLGSNEFIEGLLRLLRHEGCELSVHSLSFLHKVQVRCVKSIETCLYLQYGESEQLLGDAKAEYYWDQVNFQAMITEKRLRYLYDDLAGMLNRALENRCLKDLAPLVHVLKCKPFEIQEVLDDLRIRQFSYDFEETAEDADIDVQEFPDDDHMVESECYPLNKPIDPMPINNEAYIMNSAEMPVATSIENNTNYSKQPDQFNKTIGNGLSSEENVEFSGQSISTLISRPFVPRTSNNMGEIKHSQSAEGDISSGFEKYRYSGTLSGISRKSTASMPKTAGQQRLISYVSQKDKDINWNDSLSGDNTRSHKIYEAAVKIILDYEKKNGREAKAKLHMNHGYDIVSEYDGEIRYIKVKGTELAWGERGVTLSSTQFFYARENQNLDFWLYVVEDVFSPNPKIHQIHNPCEKVNYFIFDGGWRHATNNSERKKDKGIPIIIPSPGDEVIEDDNVVGTVESIVKAGKFQLLIYRAMNGSQVRKLLSSVMVRSKEE